ncbi:NlpC/P60 family protein [Deinococcus arenicola]|uniref:NlpC/P60 family protein n=1 Tax=Deinococcus arenicola TaxID=2994950 RepID=A0ABU4DNC1_9DEIO|nr:NlpC/P60 family protein [Deinococcus sp. ZS9-10]MDV6373920.1 NlpC/P60 family protein [Deinococcus sp. ZS9-10]
MPKIQSVARNIAPTQLPLKLPPLPALALTSLLSLGGLAGAQSAATGTLQISTVTVRAGETAYGIARRTGLSVNVLLNLNSLDTADLEVGQVLRVSATARHRVGPRETLYALSQRYSVSINALLAENTLPEGAALSVGQVLTLPATATLPSATAALASTPGPIAVAPQVLLMPRLVAPPILSVAQPPEAVPGAVAQGPESVPPRTATTPAPTPTPRPTPSAALPQSSTAALPSGDWMGAALALMGTPYRYGGTTRAGLDCSGFVLQVFAPLGVRLPRVSADQARVGQSVAASDLQPGDLVFFDTAGGGRISHVGIYLGDNTFINANSYQGKVAVDRLLGDSYWGPRYRGARRVLNAPLAMQAP